MMACSPIESHVAVTQISDSSLHDVFTNEKVLKYQQAGRTVFGGLLVSQAISAASSTVPDDFQVYSSQSSWLRAVSEKAQGKVTYHVERTSDGRSYVTRLVRVFAEDACVYIAVISFQNYKSPVDNALTYTVTMPELDFTPEEISKESNSQFTESQTNQSGGSMEPFAPEEEPFDWRPCGFEFSSDQTQVRLRGYVRATQPLAENSAPVNLAGLAYASDHMLPGVAIAANPQSVGKGGRNVTVVASLTHNVSFHDPKVQIHEWMVADRHTSWGSNGRVLVHQWIWDLKSGRLVLSVQQEALVRLKNARL